MDLSKVFLVGVSELTEKFTSIVNDALQNLPKEWNPFPEELQFLRTISWEDFERDLHRFDLYMKQGLNFRQIACLEEAERRGRHLLPSSLQGKKIGMSIPGEDGIEKSVKKIIKAIDRTPKTSEQKSYQARRRHIDTPAQGQEHFFCPAHPRGCPTLDCPHLKEWMERVNATLPTDSTGRGKEILAFDKLPEEADSAEDDNGDGW
jgi:hypothetical protein